MTYEVLDQADAIVESVDADDMSPDLRSLVNAYGPRREDGETAAAVAFAKAIVLRADREGLTAQKERSQADLKAEIKSRNEGRAEADLIKPDGQSKAALQAALDADDAK